MDDVKWIDLCGVGMGVEDLIVLSQLMQTNNVATALDLSFNKLTQSSALGNALEVGCGDEQRRVGWSWAVDRVDLSICVSVCSCVCTSPCVHVCVYVCKCAYVPARLFADALLC